MLCCCLLFPASPSQTQIGQIRKGERSYLALITLHCLLNVRLRLSPILKYVEAASVLRHGFLTSTPN